MSNAIDPQAERPSVAQSFEQSDRNPKVTDWPGNGGPMRDPADSESRITRPGAAPSQDAGLANYDISDPSYGGENDAQEG